MSISILKPEQALNKAYRKQSITRQEMDRFKLAFIGLLGKVADTDEEQQKNYVSQFLRDVFYQDYDITPHGTKDLVIRTGKASKDPVGILFEVKAPANKAEMITKENLNAKAMQELLLYYLRERVGDGTKPGNNDLKHLVVTNVKEWFVFDARLFEQLFHGKKALIKEYTSWNMGQKTSTNTSLFYKEIAQKHIAEVVDELEFTYFNIADYEKPLLNADKADDKSLISLYKLLSPQHLLKLPFANDSNSLDKQFYTELLHIIGLEEYKDGGKKLIARKPEGQRDTASLLEMCIRRIEGRNKLAKLQNPGRFGDTDAERTYAVALELCITWMNRVLFLKLLEAQLRTYNNGDERFRFLTPAFIPEFDELEKLFFDVLAKKPAERYPDVTAKFGHIPYLNSSLFEQTGLEEDVVHITDMDDLAQMPVWPGTILKDGQGKHVAKNTQMRTLHYLFAFLDAYSFSSEGGEDIQEQNKRLINASVLGLIFEKINGYKDGSFFTPGFITMYMCRETIRRATVQKFNERYGWQVATFELLHEQLEVKDAAKRKEYNEVINSLKICDPAVGSGHFLVSALNEVIAIKHELKLLCYRDGQRVDRDWNIEIQNDELMIQDADYGFFQYRLSTDHKHIPQLQKLQETLFHEKQTIIENCLFGVDINPNSVKICRLRLWIELLKNAYYNAGSGYTDLETLPNIDINIKEGNSLVSRFALTDSLSKALKSIKYSIADYKYFVQEYKSSTDKELKKGFETLINQIKGDFKTDLSESSKEYKDLYKYQQELYLKYEKAQLFGDTLTKEQIKHRDDLVEKVNEAKRKVDEVKSNKIYRNAFEWRFEFPEVLDDNGEFIGFDVVIGNPPYMQLDTSIKDYFNSRFSIPSTESANLFVQLAKLLLTKDGFNSYIIPKSFLYTSNYKQLRESILQELIAIVDCGKAWVEVKLEMTIYLFGKGSISGSYNSLISDGQTIDDEICVDKSTYVEFELLISGFSPEELLLGRKILLGCSTKLGDFVDNIRGGNYQKVIRSEGILKVIGGADIGYYGLKSEKGFIRSEDINQVKTDNSLSKERSILVQNIVAHIKNPASHIKIIATLAPKESVILLDTVNQLTPKNETIINSKTIWALLKSKLINWYTFKYIFGNAIRTMHFDNGITDRIPLANIIDQLPINVVVDQILAAKEADPTADTTALEAKIDQLVYQLYGLTEDEIKIVEESVG